MSAPQQSHNDGNIPHGAPLGQTVPQSGVFAVYSDVGNTRVGYFKFDGPDFNRPGNTIKVKNPDGSPQGSIGIPDHDTMTCQVQVPTSTGPFIRRGHMIQEEANTDGFVGTSNQSGTGANDTVYNYPNAIEWWICETASQAFPADGKWMQQTTWIKVYNPNAAVVTLNPQ